MLQTFAPKFTKILDLPQQPWSNGEGVTRVLGTDQAIDSESWNWRLSLASLAQESSFSPMGDAVRILTVASNGPVSLNLNGTEHELALGMQAQFLDSDRATVTSAGPEEYVLSLVVRRGQAFGSVETQRVRGRKVFSPSDLWHRIIVLEGSVKLSDGTVLRDLSIIEPSETPLELHADNALLAHVVVLESK